MSKSLQRISKSIPKALRQQAWITNIGEKFKSKCTVGWCRNEINVFNFECGHNIPESKGGKTVLENLYPICRQCNASMNNKYTITEWQKLGNKKSIFCCFK